jgi:hypothetical protein
VLAETTRCDYLAQNLLVLEARADWISCSASMRRNALKLGTLAGEGINHEAERGEKVRAWSTHGYEGFSAGRWRWASTKEHVIVQVSQEEAAIWAKPLADLSSHWSRVDYCVTVVDEAGKVHPDVDYWDLWLNSAGVKRRGASFQRTQQAWGGATVNVGSRQSTHFLRCYNKHEESDHRYPKGSWRWEVELKGVASEHEHSLWKAGSMSEIQTSGLVADAFRHYGLPIPWRAYGRDTQHSAGRSPADADRLLSWFHRQVRPSVAFVKEQRGIQPVSDALGLTVDMIRLGAALRERTEGEL